MLEGRGVGRKFVAGQALSQRVRQPLIHTPAGTEDTSWENLFPAKSELKSDSEKLASEYEDA